MSASRFGPGFEDLSGQGLPEEAPLPKQFVCDACGERFDGLPGGAGLFLWTRGDEVRYEEPPLCEACASEITVGALLRFDFDEEEEG
ncbi:MAG: hypothetical protein IPI67_33200 [Myxococcales bacterium]|nr:hypothetical protein [Myxococcales bacterium]